MEDLAGNVHPAPGHRRIHLKSVIEKPDRESGRGLDVECEKNLKSNTGNGRTEFDQLESVGSELHFF